MDHPQHTFWIAPGYEQIVEEIGLSPQDVFTRPDIVRWRTVDTRDNCTLDAQLADGRKLRLHIKRHQPGYARDTPAHVEYAGYELLRDANIPTANLVAFGELLDRRSFLVTEDLAGFSAADKLIEHGTPFPELSNTLADLTARLHNAGLHHRDLYLCHFFVNPQSNPRDIRLIDIARVAKLPRFFRRRWIIKDLAQFWYSTTNLPIPESDRVAWLERYAQSRNMSGKQLLSRIKRKARQIARHDKNLTRRHPSRNISIEG